MGNAWTWVSRVGVAVAVGLSVLTIAVPASAMPTITLVSPANGAIADDSVAVSATVTSPFVLTSVAAQIGATSAPMTAGALNKWSVTLDISAEPIAPATMTITATDANGDTATSNVSLIHDRAPVLAVLTPTLSVGRPSMRLRATCTDTDAYGCTSLSAAVRKTGDSGAFTTVATTAAAALDQTVSLAAFEGMTLDIMFTATDLAGAKTSTTIQGYVESSPNLALVDEMDGRVLDVDATRILFVNDTGVYIKDRTTGVVANIGSGTLATETKGHLASTGAVWTNGDYLNGVTTARTHPLVMARGDWAIRQPNSSVGPVTRQDLTIGAIDVVWSGQVYGYGDIDAAGTAVYGSFSGSPFNRYDIHRAPVGGPDVVVIPQGTLGIPSPVGPIIADGSTIVFAGHHNRGRAPIAVYSALGTAFLDASTSTFLGYTLPYVSYRAEDGWIGYTKDVAGSLTAWTRSPAGVEALASALNNVRVIAGVNANGEIVYDVGLGTARYVSAAGPAGPTKALAIGAGNGVMRWFGGSWYELLGRNVFRVEPAPSGAPDAGAPEGGSSSGGSSGSSGSSGSTGPTPPDASGGSSGGPGAGPPDVSSSGAPTGGATSTDPPSPADDAAGGCSAVASSPAPGGAILAVLAILASLGRRRRRPNRGKTGVTDGA